MKVVLLVVSYKSMFLQQSGLLIDNQVAWLACSTPPRSTTVVRAISNYVQLWMCIRYNQGLGYNSYCPPIDKLFRRSLWDSFRKKQYLLLQKYKAFLSNTTTTKESKWKEIHMLLLLISFITVLQPKQISFCCPARALLMSSVLIKGLSGKKSLFLMKFP